uniref:Uncharacterized protein n=1 Tax=Meloidogyne floridensis TaxID=298350 RepID=A0A915NV49_9BILA
MYFIFIAGPIYEYIYKIHCIFPDLTWFRNLWPFRGGNGQNVGVNNQQIHHQDSDSEDSDDEDPDLDDEDIHHLQQQIPCQSSSSNLQQLRSFNRQLSVNYPPYPQQDSDDEGSDIGHEHSQSTYYSYRDRKRRSVTLMSQNDKEKVENGNIPENNFDKNSTINYDNNADANQND